MSVMRFSIPHNLTQEQAQQRLQGLFPQLEQQYTALVTEVGYQWHNHICDFQLRIRALTISGRLTVQPQTIDLELDLPLAAMFFKDTIQQTIQSQAQILLEPKKP